MLLDRFDKDLNARDLYLAERDGQWGALFAADPPGSPVRNLPVGIEGAKIATNRDVSLPEFESNSGRFQCASADLVLKWIVTEQTEVAGSASRCDARLDWNTSTLDPQLCKSAQVWRRGGFQFGLSPRRHWQSTQSVSDEHNNFAAVAQLQFTGQSVHVHTIAFQAKMSRRSI